MRSCSRHSGLPGRRVTPSVAVGPRLTTSHGSIRRNSA
ncbi:hypothetical protein JDM601_3137 [Mycolicibacter sinensis]|uniref:Uncharacterized protein n=1 Tax=Mycolicibacter sinensis (strain JDM601) TaxID=875328 RepID=F5Z322_MYCSD|nr:hypothetical protein JDM601_3137 [Mycolicibacter sinensis]